MSETNPTPESPFEEPTILPIPNIGPSLDVELPPWIKKPEPPKETE